MQDISYPTTLGTSISVVGLGYVGLSLAKILVECGFHVTGIDVDVRKIEKLSSGVSYLSVLSNGDVQAMNQSGRFSCNTSFHAIVDSNVIIVCVPTPLTNDGQPDLSYVENASVSISKLLQPSQLVILESSTLIGTTEERVVPILEQSGMTAGTDFFVAYSPERINPGVNFDIRKVPKVLAGINSESTRRVTEIYEKVFERVVVVSSIRVAELTKLLENTQRFINISLMNELVVHCDRWNINLWEAIDAASTKPYGFSPYYPGPGVGGHCIPVDPLYLQWVAEEHGTSLEFIKLAHTINESMPEYVVNRIRRLCTSDRQKVLLVGLTYKPDVNDLRGSPAVRILQQLQSAGFDVAYHDPFVREASMDLQSLQSVDLTPDTLRKADMVVILTNHSNVDYELIRVHARTVLDTRNVYGSASCSANIETL